jgi:hypothetical protein
VRRAGKPAAFTSLPVKKRTLERNVPRTIRFALPAAARDALADGAKVSATFTLTAKNANGPARGATARIKRLKLAAP